MKNGTLARYLRYAGKTLFVMKRIIISICAIVALLTSVNASAQNENWNYIEVRGSAEKTVAPDKITLSISISEKNYRNRSLDQLEKDLVSALKSAGFDVAKQLKVKDMSSTLKWNKAKNQEAVMSKNYLLELTDAASVAKAMSAMENVGIANAYIEKAEYIAIDSLKAEVKAEAMKNARKYAEAMVGAIGQELGKAIYIYDQDNGVSYYYKSRGMAMNAMADCCGEEEAALPELEFREIKVIANVNVRFSL